MLRDPPESDFGFVHQVLTFTRRDDHSPFSLHVRLGARVPESINLLMKYGPVYLTKTEFQRKLAGLSASYCIFLLRSLPRVADRSFRAYHGPALRLLLRKVNLGDVLEGVRLHAEAANPVMLYSIGKDSSVMLHLARKAFHPASRPSRSCTSTPPGNSATCMPSAIAWPRRSGSN